MLPFLYALQYYPENKAQAMALARLIADLEPGPNRNMGFMFCPRFDTVVDPPVEAMVRSKFPDTKIYQTRSRATGWPKGCNAQLHDVYTHFHHMHLSERPDRWQYCAILMGEPDCVPLDKDWIAKLQWEWYNCDWGWALGSRQLVLGHWLTGKDVNCGTPHINGNCMISPQFLSVYPAFRVTNVGAWDTTHQRAILNYGRPSKLIFSDYKLGSNENPWKGCEDLWKVRHMSDANPLRGQELRPVYLHGCKDMRAQECVRAKLLS